MYKIQILFLIVLFSSINFSCTDVDNSPLPVDYSQLIIGEWKEVRTFDLINEFSNPPAYDWFAVEEGFVLKIDENGTFNYTRFGNCSTGNYISYPDLAKIEFNFDCEIEFNGSITTKLVQYFEKNNSNTSQLMLWDESSSTLCREGCTSIIKRTE